MQERNTPKGPGPVRQVILPLAILAAAGPLAHPASAEPATPSTDRGSIIISRDVGPRNALLPEIGHRDIVFTAPDQADVGLVSAYPPISDAEASAITGSIAQLQSIGATVQAPMDTLAGSGQVSAGGGVGHGTGAIGETIGGAIGAGMAVIASTLGALGSAAP